MPAFRIAAAALLLVAAATMHCHAVGLYVVGKEDCDCSPLIARGVVPDTLNLLKEAFVLPQFVFAVDQIGVTLRNAVVQVTQPSPEVRADVRDDEGDSKEVEKPQPKREKHVIEKPVPKNEKPAVQLKKDEKKKKTKKRVNIPARSM